MSTFVRRGTAIIALFLAVFCISLIAAIPTSVDAAVVRASRDVVSVPDDAVVPGDFYAFGSDIKIAGVVEGDVYAFGGTVTITGSVAGDVVALGGRISVRGPVADDVRVLGGEVVLEESIGGDAFLFAGDLSLEKAAQVVGDLFIYAGEVRVDGGVTGAAYVRAGELLIDGSIGSVDALIAGPLTLGSRAHISRDVLYESPTELRRAQDAIVDGNVTRREIEKDPADSFKGVIAFTLMTLFVSLISVLLFRERLEALFTQYGGSVGVSGFVGLGCFFGTPLAFILLFISLLGIFAGFFLLAFYIALLCAAGVLTGVFIGAGIMRFVRKTYQVTWFSALLGVLTIPILLLIPVAGPIVLLAIYLAVVGILVRHVYGLLRP